MIEKGGGPSYSQQNPGLIKKGFEDILGGEAKHTQLRNAATAGRKVGEATIQDIQSIRKHFFY